MLVLTRRLGESIVIGENIIVTVLSVKGGQVRLGIEAPKEVSIQREELLKTEKSSTPVESGSLVKKLKKLGKSNKLSV